MAYRKDEEFSRPDRELADWAKALSHPARVAILREVARRGTCICGEIVEVIPLAQSTVSRHLAALLEAGLLSGSIDGPKSCYCVNVKALSRLGSAFSSLVDGVRVDAFRCCE